MPDKTVAQIGEFGLIDRIASIVPAPGADVVAGIGDDVAVIRMGDHGYLLWTCDALVAGVHFAANLDDPYAAGHKAAAVNLSDIASMGGRPRYALVSLALPRDCRVVTIDAIYRGLSDQLSAWETYVVGGNITRADQLMIDVTLLGSVDDGRPVLRSGARVGDSLLVTGRLGAAAAGLRLMLTETGPLVATQALKGLLDAQRRPTPRVHEGWIIGSSGLASAMIDISDGLTADLGHLCDASRVGVVVNAAALPIDPATTDAAARLDADPLELALFGGEDYELLFTAAPDAAPGLVEAVQGQTGTPVTVIGHITPANRGRQLVQLNGNRTYLPGGGWDHLRR